MRMFAAFALVLILHSCKKSSSDGSQSLQNVSYGSHAQQKMDIYLPAGRNETDTKLIVLIHGGGWTDGDKSNFAEYITTLKERLPDYAIANINYRLSTGVSNQFPTQEEDVQAAIEYLVYHSEEYQISRDLVLLGASAGGHLALLQGYKSFFPVKVKAIIDFFGPTDLTEMYDSASNQLIKDLLEDAVGGTPATHSQLYFQSSPINYVSAQSPPTIILQGGMDFVVPPSQSTNLRDALQASSVPHQFVFYPNEQHGWVGAPLDDSFDKIEAFLALHVQ